MSSGKTITDAEYATLLQVGDPLADAAAGVLARAPAETREKLLAEALSGSSDSPEALRQWISQMERVPSWVDWDLLLQGSRAFLRAGGLGLFALCCCATPSFYRLSNGNKALSYSGDLKVRAARRGRETCRFVIETCLANNLRRNGDGFEITLRVRLMHAHVRRGLLHSGKWNSESHGVPINQVYMAAMSALLSARWIDALGHLGHRLDADEVKAMIHLWCYSSYLMGIQEPLLFKTKAEADAFLALVDRHEPAPDEDARFLVRSLFESIPAVLNLSGKKARWMFGLCEGMAFSMLGEKVSRQLLLRRTFWRHVPRLTRVAVPVWKLLERLSPKARKQAQYFGVNLWLSLAEFPNEGGLGMFTATAKEEASSNESGGN